MIKILFFGRLSDVSETLTCALPHGVSTINALSSWLGEENAALGEALSAKGNRIAKNQQIVAVDAPISDGDEIAFMSPLSGG